MLDTQFILKTTPPRASRAALVRQKLGTAWAEMRDRAVISVAAPAGFGKTTQMVQWRRQWLEQGAIVAWAVLDDRDDPIRFASLLLYSMRQASGRAAFDKLMQEYIAASSQGLDAVTGLLAEVAALATPTVLMLDDADRLPAQTQEGPLAYLLFNAPPNLHIVVGARRSLRLPTADLGARGQFGSLRVDDLRLELFESVAILEKRFGTRLSLDDAVRLHETTEGWPLGLQLAATAIERMPDLHRAVATLTARRGDIEQYFIESSFSRFAPDVADFLTRISILDDVTPDLCEAVTGDPRAAALLDQLSAESPMAVVGEMRDWMRIHALGRDFLLGRFEKLPQDEQRTLHRRAADWLAAHERFHEAGRHALAAGDEDRARDHAKRSLWVLGTQGRLREAREWVDRLPDEALVGDDNLRLVAAWVMAVANRPADSLAITQRMRAEGFSSDDARSTCALVVAAAAVYLDRPGLVLRALDDYGESPTRFATPVHELSYVNCRAMAAMCEGNTDLARRLEAPYTGRDGDESMGIALALGRALQAFSHLWDAENYKAETLMRRELDAAERETGRRSVKASLYAVPLAAAVYDRGDALGARALLANRIDVVEQTGLPDSLLLAYRTLSGIASQQGDERAALDALGTLDEIGRDRGMPRLCVVSLAEQVRLHATRSRVETAAALLGAIDSLQSRFDEPDFLTWRPLFQMLRACSRAYVALARGELDAADEHLRICDGHAAQIRSGRHQLMVQVLRAVIAHERGQDAAPLLQEVMGLMSIRGTLRILADTHPHAVRMAEDHERRARKASGPEDAPLPRPAPAPRAGPVAGGLLTPKEAEVLRLLDGGMSNKLIAKTMDISDETVKWHLKNLFSKLNAGTRKHAVDRARLLGLIGQ